MSRSTPHQMSIIIEVLLPKACLDMRATVALTLGPALRKVADATATSDTAAADVWRALPTASNAVRSPKTMSKRKPAVSELAMSFLMRLEPAFHTALTQFGTP